MRRRRRSHSRRPRSRRHKSGGARRPHARRRRRHSRRAAPAAPRHHRRRSHKRRHHAFEAARPRHHKRGRRKSSRVARETRLENELELAMLEGELVVKQLGLPSSINPFAFGMFFAGYQKNRRDWQEKAIAIQRAYSVSRAGKTAEVVAALRAPKVEAPRMLPMPVPKPVRQPNDLLSLFGLGSPAASSSSSGGNWWDTAGKLSNMPFHMGLGIPDLNSIGQGINTGVTTFDQLLEKAKQSAQQLAPYIGNGAGNAAPSGAPQIPASVE